VRTCKRERERERERVRRENVSGRAGRYIENAAQPRKDLMCGCAHRVFVEGEIPFPRSERALIKYIESREPSPSILLWT
jgi:hypothetical protein